MLYLFGKGKLVRASSILSVTDFCSQVFKDLLAVPGSEAERQSVIALSDENDEEAESLEDFLDILHDDDEIWDTVDCPTWRIKRAIRLLDKYDCPSARKRFARRVRLDRFASGSVQDADLTFHISMLLDDPLGCKEAIVAAASGSQRFEDLHDTAIQYGKGSMQNPVEGGHYLDVRAWSLNTVKECRVEYMVALSRAWLIVDKDGPKVGKLKEVSDEFYRLMTR